MLRKKLKLNLYHKNIRSKLAKLKELGMVYLVSVVFLSYVIVIPSACQISVTENNEEL